MRVAVETGLSQTVSQHIDTKCEYCIYFDISTELNNTNVFVTT